MHFDLTDLALFLNVVEAGSITAGAARSHLALASASARVRDLEVQAGTRLLERGHRGVEPTPAGRALAHHARRVMQQVERLRGEMGEYAHGLKGHVRLLANTAAAAEFLPEALAGFLAAHPSVDVDLDERPSVEVTRAVAAGFADVGIAADHADFAGLERFAFRVDRLVLAVPRGHALAARRRVAFAEALGSDFVGLAGDSALQRHLAGHALRAGARMRLRARVHGLDAACRMVALGAGAAVIPEAAARRHAAGGALRVVALADPWARRELRVVARRLDALPAHAQRLVEHLIGPADAAPRSTGRVAAGTAPRGTATLARRRHR